MRSPKTWLLVVLSFALFGIGVNTQSGWAFLLVALALGALIFSYSWARFSLTGLTVRRRVTPEVHQGSELRVELVLSSKGRWPRLLVVARDELFEEFREAPAAAADDADGMDSPAGPADMDSSGRAAGMDGPGGLAQRRRARKRVKGNRLVFPIVKRDGPVKLAYPARATRRGHFDKADVILSTSAPLGLVECRSRLSVVSPITVYPRYAELTTLPVLEASSTPAEQVHERGRKGSGLEYYGSREYASGDSLRFVHWRAVARTARLMVKEFEREAAPTVTVVLDTRAGHNIGGEPARHGSRPAVAPPGSGATADAQESSLDYAAAVAASICRYVIRAGHPVRLVASGPAGPMIFEHPDWWQALSWLARLKAEGALVLDELVRRVASELESRCTMVIIAPTLEMNCAEAFAEAQRHHARAIGILLEAESFLGGPQPPGGTPNTLSADGCRDLVGALTQGRAIVYLCRQGEDIAECLRQPFGPTGA